MKKMIIVLMALLTLGFVSTNVKASTLNADNLYPLTTVVTELNNEIDLVTCVDFNGKEHYFFGVEDWQVGDICSMMLDSKGTENINDDELINYRYNGYFKGWEKKNLLPKEKNHNLGLTIICILMIGVFGFVFYLAENVIDGTLI